MAKKVIITIARQYGSGGREIGERVAEILGIPIYDKEIITHAAEKGNLNEEVLKSADESATNSLLYTLAMGSNVLGTTMHFGYKMPINDKLFILQSELIKEYASSDANETSGLDFDFNFDIAKERGCCLPFESICNSPIGKTMEWIIFRCRGQRKLHPY